MQALGWARQLQRLRQPRSRRVQVWQQAARKVQLRASRRRGQAPAQLLLGMQVAQVLGHVQVQVQVLVELPRPAGGKLPRKVLPRERCSVRQQEKQEQPGRKKAHGSSWCPPPFRSPSRPPQRSSPGLLPLSSRPATPSPV